jgi:outer membrane immunogenic protein
MRKILLAAAAVTASFVVPAQAADLARPAPVYAPPPPVIAVFTWTGCYVGANGGGIWSQHTFTNTGFIPAVPAFGVPAVVGGADFGSQTVSGGLGGLQVGCNYQVANWVFGIQGDYDWVGAKGDTNNTGAAIGFGLLGGVTNHIEIKSLASVTGRVGYAWGRFLGYVKAGGAWVRDEYSLQTLGVVGGTGTFATATETRGGWTVGIGGEYAFLDWLTGFVEYDYYGFGTKTNNLACAGVVVAGVAGCGLFVPTTFGVDIKQNVNVFKVGVNLKFGGGFGGF